MSEASCPAGFRALDPDAHPDDLVEGFARARRDAPVYQDPESGWFVVSGYRELEEVVRDWATFSSEMSGAPQIELPDEFRNDLPNGWPIQKNLAMMDPPEHTRVRKLAQVALTTGAANARAQDIRAVCDELIDGFIAKRATDLVEDYCRVVPPRVVGPIFGVPDTEALQLHIWSMQAMMMVVNLYVTQDMAHELGASQAAFARFVSELVAERREHPRGPDDLLTSLIAARDDDDGSRLSDDELMMLVVGIIAAGGETGMATIGHAVHSLLSDPAAWSEVVADPSLLTGAVEETLRARPPVRNLFRVARRDTELAGVHLPAGSVLTLSLPSAGRDESVFDEPDRFDIHRANVKQHITFAKGPHFCIGAALARVEVRVALEALVERIPSLRLVPGHRLEYVPTIGVPSLLSGLVAEWEP